MRKQYNLIIFDVDGTFYKFRQKIVDGNKIILPIRKEVISRGVTFISERLNVSEVEAKRISEDNIRHYGSVSTGLEKRYGINRQEYFSVAWDIDPSNYIDGDERLSELIKKITTKRATLSSSPEVWIERVLKWFGIYGLFDGIWFGDSEENKKPNIVAYTQVLDFFDVSAEETLIVDDETRFLKPAKELGMTTILVGSGNESFVDYNIGDIHEVHGLLKDLV